MSSSSRREPAPGSSSPANGHDNTAGTGRPDVNGEPAGADAEHEHDPVTGMSTQQLTRLADEAYEQRDTPQAWQEEPPAQVDSTARSVISVRFNKGELGQIEQAATRAGLPVSTYIRLAALMAASPQDIDDVRRTVQLLSDAQESLTRVRRHLSTERLKTEPTTPR